MDVRTIARQSMLLSLSVVLSIIEGMIPILSGWIPGLKLGLANIVVLYVLYTHSVKEAFCLSILRVILVGMLQTGLFSLPFFFSLSGAVFSVSAMAFFKKTSLSIIGVSVIGSLFHCLGQILIAILLLQTNAFLAYLPWLLLGCIPTGILVGMATKTLNDRLNHL